MFGSNRKRRKSLLRLSGSLTLIVGLAAQGAALYAAPPALQWKHYPVDSRAPRGAPNILLILTDDVGFGASSTFGGPIPTPTLDALAISGLRYNQFHVTAMCSPTRASLLTGRNHHRVGYGAIANVAVDEPGYTSAIPDSAASIGKVLKQNGYDTAWFGKSHITPLWETGPAGPFDRWPNAMGFDYFYGFHGASTSQFYPSLVEDHRTVLPPQDPAYILDNDLATRTIHWIGTQRSQHPDRPFLVYYAPGTMHGPQQAPADWIARFRGQFNQGWDKLREETFARQKRMGIIPTNSVLTGRPKELPAWDSLSPQAKLVHARMMEVAAAQLAYCDDQIGRIIMELRKRGDLENTLIFFIQGDNGAAMEDQFGTFNEYHFLQGIIDDPGNMPEMIEKAGGPETAQTYSPAWAWAMNTPFQWGKQIASHLGGIRDGLVVSWPSRIKVGGAIRNQFTHVTDIAPTIYEAAGIASPSAVEGVAQMPLDGVSMVYSFDSPNAKSMHRTQYFEMLGNLGYYKDGWLASTIPGRTPWDLASSIEPAKLRWALYNLSEDFSQSRDLASTNPAKLEELKIDFHAAATQNRVYPIASNILARADHRNRPSVVRGRSTVKYQPGTAVYPEAVFPPLRETKALVVNLATSGAADSGTLMMQGDMTSSMSLMLENGRPVFFYNPTGRESEQVRLSAEQPLAAGRHQVQLTLTPGEHSAAPVTATLIVDGESLSSAKISKLYNIIGDAFIGSVGPGPLIWGGPRSTPCNCTVDEVTIELRTNNR